MILLRYHQVLINLLSNAIKFTKTGSVTIKLSAQPATKDNRVLLVEVIDTGIGIPLAAQAGLFEVFVQVDASDTRQYGGSGLGLAISKRLVDLWEGHIGVESTPAIGSRFWFTVGSGALSPALQTTTDLIKEKDAPLPFIANLLLVDDSPINQAVIIYMLRDAGHEWHGSHKNHSSIGRSASNGAYHCDYCPCFSGLSRLMLGCRYERLCDQTDFPKRLTGHRVKLVRQQDGNR